MSTRAQTVDGALFVEFIGLPGSGKSTLSHRVAQSLRALGVPVTEPTYWLDHVAHRYVRQSMKALLALTTILTFPRLALYCFDGLRRTRQRTWRDFLMTFLNFAYVSLTIKRLSKTPGVHFLDQGLLQAVWSIGYSSNAGESVLRHYGRVLRLLLPARLVAVIVHASTATLVERLAMRPARGSRLERLVDSGQLAHELDRGTGLVASIEEYLTLLSADARGIKVVKVLNENGDRILEGCVNDVRRIVCGYLSMNSASRGLRRGCSRTHTRPCSGSNGTRLQK